MAFVLDQSKMPLHHRLVHRKLEECDRTLIIVRSHNPRTSGYNFTVVEEFTYDGEKVASRIVSDIVYDGEAWDATYRDMSGTKIHQTEQGFRNVSGTVVIHAVMDRYIEQFML